VARNQDVDDDEFAGLGGDSGTDVETQTSKLLDAPQDDPPGDVELVTDPAEAVIRLASSLPSLDDVAAVEEDDTSALTDAEQVQKAKTEEVILTAHAAGRAAVWVIGQGIAAASKGRWFRATHQTLEEYIADLVPDVVPRQARRWVKGSTVALAIAARTGQAPVEGQVRPLVEARRDVHVDRDGLGQLGVAAAATVAKETGAKVTAQVLKEFRDVVEDEDLPEDPEEQQATLQEWAREVLVPGPNGPGMFETESNGGVGEDGADDDVQDAEVVETPHLDALDQALVDLKAARKAVKRTTFEGAADEGDHDRYRQLVSELRTLTEELQRAARRAPAVAVAVPAPAEPQDDTVQPEAAMA
jgi:hypothetical protein